MLDEQACATRRLGDLLSLPRERLPDHVQKGRRMIQKDDRPDLCVRDEHILDGQGDVRCVGGPSGELAVGLVEVGAGEDRRSVAGREFGGQRRADRVRERGNAEHVHAAEMVAVEAERDAEGGAIQRVASWKHERGGVQKCVRVARRAGDDAGHGRQGTGHRGLAQAHGGERRPPTNAVPAVERGGDGRAHGVGQRQGARQRCGEPASPVRKARQHAGHTSRSRNVGEHGIAEQLTVPVVRG